MVLCHTDPKHIKRLTDKITETGDEAFIHVDAKIPIEPFEQELKDNAKVHIITQRVYIHWGGYSSIEATVNLFRAAISEGNNFDRFVILQGLEYPIKTNRDIHAFFQSNREKEFILAQNISQSSNYKQKHKYSLYWYLDSTSILHRIVNFGNGKLFLNTKCIPQFKRNYVKNKSGEKMYIYQGCAQFAVTRALAEYFVKFHDENKKFNRYFQTMYAPDEAYFQTIVYNSPFAAHTLYGKAIEKDHLEDFENVTYFEYPVTVTLFTQKSDWPRLRDSGFLYFRKASSESKELLDYIDEQHAKQELASAQ